MAAVLLAWVIIVSLMSFGGMLFAWGTMTSCPISLCCRMPAVLCKARKDFDRAYFIRAQHIPCQGLSVLVPCVQPSLASLLMKPKMGMHENIFEYNGGNKRKLHSYFPDPTTDIDNKVCSQLHDCLHCHGSADLFPIIALQFGAACIHTAYCGLSAGCLACCPAEACPHPVVEQLWPRCPSGSNLQASDDCSVHAAGPGNIPTEVQARHARVVGGPQGVLAAVHSHLVHAQLWSALT